MKLIRVVGGASALAAAFVAFMGFAHTQAGRPVLAWMGQHARSPEFCPLGYDRKASIEDREAARARVYAARVDKPSLAARPALTFRIGESTRAEIENWISASGGHCKPVASPVDLECAGNFHGAETSTWWLEFDRGDRLVAMRGIEKFRAFDAAKSLFVAIRESQRGSSGGGALEIAGSLDAIKKQGALLAQASLKSDFRNYSMVTRITNMGDTYAVSHDFTGF